APSPDQDRRQVGAASHCHRHIRLALTHRARLHRHAQRHDPTV
ncbi:MAG: hypothetical protein AVDCRST_MAG21-737, partial [uncultured Nocardioidaceae bacterium]